MTEEKIFKIEKEKKGYLSEMYGSQASFRDGQLDALIKLFTNKFTLLVQKTRWEILVVVLYPQKLAYAF